MIKNWNQRVDIKRDNRLIGVKFIDAHQYSQEIGMWEVLTGTIHMNRAEFGQRPTDKVVSRFEVRCYKPYELLMVELKPMDHPEIRMSLLPWEYAAHRMGHDGSISIDWVRERVVDSWLEFVRIHEKPEAVA